MQDTLFSNVVFFLQFCFYSSLTQCKISINWAINSKMQTNKIEKDTQPQHINWRPTISSDHSQKKNENNWKEQKKCLCRTTEIEVSTVFFFFTTPWNCGNFIASTVYSIPHTRNITNTSAKKTHAIDTKKNSIFSPRSPDFYYDYCIYFIYLFIIVRAYSHFQLWLCAEVTNYHNVKLADQ